MPPISMGKGGSKDALRLCPTCRMSISVLATVCHFCGTTVGRPKEEARKITQEDLGGETVGTFKASDSFIGALKAFAQLDLSTSDLGGLPDLDEESKTLRSMVQPDAADSAPQAVRKKNAAQDVPWIPVLAGVLALFVVVAVVLRFTIFAPQQVVEGYRSRVPALIAQGAAPIQVLEAAAEAIRVENNDVHRQQAEEAWQAVREEIFALLNAPNWTPDLLREAEVLAKRCAMVYSNEETEKVLEEVREEVTDYNIVLAAVDKDTGEVTFRVAMRIASKAKGDLVEEMVVKQGELLRDRFEVEAVYRSAVRLRDRKRQPMRSGTAVDRILSCKLGEGPRTAS